MIFVVKAGTVATDPVQLMQTVKNIAAALIVLALGIQILALPVLLCAVCISPEYPSREAVKAEDDRLFGPHDSGRKVVNVDSFGAVGDGLADDTAAIQSAVNSGPDRIITGIGMYLITKPIHVRANHVELRDVSLRLQNLPRGTTIPFDLSGEGITVIGCRFDTVQ